MEMYGKEKEQEFIKSIYDLDIEDYDFKSVLCYEYFKLKQHLRYATSQEDRIEFLRNQFVTHLRLLLLAPRILLLFTEDGQFMRRIGAGVNNYEKRILDKIAHSYKAGSCSNIQSQLRSQLEIEDEQLIKREGRRVPISYLFEEIKYRCLVALNSEILLELFFAEDRYLRQKMSYLNGLIGLLGDEPVPCLLSESLHNCVKEIRTPDKVRSNNVSTSRLEFQNYKEWIDQQTFWQEKKQDAILDLQSDRILFPEAEFFNEILMKIKQEIYNQFISFSDWDDIFRVSFLIREAEIGYYRWFLLVDQRAEILYDLDSRKTDIGITARDYSLAKRFRFVECGFVNYLESIGTTAIFDLDRDMRLVGDGYRDDPDNPGSKDAVNRLEREYWQRAPKSCERKIYDDERGNSIVLVYNFRSSENNPFSAAIELFSITEICDKYKSTLGHIFSTKEYMKKVGLVDFAHIVGHHTYNTMAGMEFSNPYEDFVLQNIKESIGWLQLAVGEFNPSRHIRDEQSKPIYSLIIEAYMAGLDAFMRGFVKGDKKYGDKLLCNARFTPPLLKIHLTRKSSTFEILFFTMATGRLWPKFQLPSDEDYLESVGLGDEITIWQPAKIFVKQTPEMGLKIGSPEVRNGVEIQKIRLKSVHPFFWSKIDEHSVLFKLVNSTGFNKFNHLLVPESEFPEYSALSIPYIRGLEGSLQEVFLNAFKYGKFTHRRSISVNVNIIPEPESAMRLIIENDSDVESDSGGYGLRGIQEFAQHLSIRSEAYKNSSFKMVLSFTSPPWGLNSEQDTLRWNREN